MFSTQGGSGSEALRVVVDGAGFESAVCCAGGALGVAMTNLLMRSCFVPWARNVIEEGFFGLPAL